VLTAPYNHANLDSDEVIHYVSRGFFSQRGIEEGALTFHPAASPNELGAGLTELSRRSAQPRKRVRRP
jgi:homogentisate 1,2-dioxygenase